MVTPLLEVYISHYHTEERCRWVKQIVTDMAAMYRVEVVEDTWKEGCWPTVKRCFEAAARGQSEWFAIFADDMIPVPGLAPAIPYMIRGLPHTVLTLFTFRRGYVRLAQENGVTWVAGRDAVWGGAMIYPHHAAEAILKFSERIKDDYPHDDVRVALWLKEQGVPALVAVPSVLEHEGAEKSVMGHGGLNRRAALLAKNAMDVPWRPRWAEGPTGRMAKVPDSIWR